MNPWLTINMLPMALLNLINIGSHQTFNQNNNVFFLFFVNKTIINTKMKTNTKNKQTQSTGTHTHTTNNNKFE